uniref:Nuclease HARBI1 n=1 Tax=Cacopsylla melanoneura TaxID=428564 RepID=A0A8D8YZ19_9HEMI
MLPPPTEERWRQIALKFEEICKFPNCIGAVDGKHVVIQAPKNSGSQFFNYKKTFSTVLMALVDAECNFIAVDVGGFGRHSDGGIFAHSNLGKALETGRFNVPGPSALPGTNAEAPYVVVGDQAFPLKNYLMRPYPGENLPREKEVFNMRLTKARRVVENAFGILAQKFRIYNRRIHADPDNVDNMVMATCILHNFIKMHDRKSFRVPLDSGSRGSVESSGGIQNLPLQGGNASQQAFQTRELFKEYFNSAIGMIPIQQRAVPLVPPRR